VTTELNECPKCGAPLPCEYHPPEPKPEPKRVFFGTQVAGVVTKGLPDGTVEITLPGTIIEFDHTVTFSLL